MEVKRRTKVYRYGCKAFEPEEHALVEAQLWLAYRYRLMLWFVSCASRAQYRARRRECMPEIAALEQQLEDLDAQVLETPRKSPERAELRAQQKVLRGALSAARKRTKDSPRFQRLVEEDHKRELELRRALRKAMGKQGLYSGTYQQVEDADRRSRSGMHDPARPRWNRTGVLAIQLAGGRSVPQLESGKDPSVHFPARPAPPPGVSMRNRVYQRVTTRYRVCSQDRRPVSIQIKTMHSRPLPPDADVKWVKLVVERSGNRFIYSQHFVLSSAMVGRKEYGEGVVAVCFEGEEIKYAGLKKLDSKVPRVFDEGVKAFAGGAALEHVHKLQALRDRLRNELVVKLQAWVETLEDPPSWVINRLARASQSKASCQQLRFYGDRVLRECEQWMEPELARELRVWVYETEDHLYQWQSDARRRALLNRLDRYRCFAKYLRSRYHTILLDNRALDAPRGRTQERNSLALDRLRAILRDSFGDECVVALTGPTCRTMFERYLENKTEPGWKVQRSAA